MVALIPPWRNAEECSISFLIKRKQTIWLRKILSGSQRRCVSVLQIGRKHLKRSNCFWKISRKTRPTGTFVFCSAWACEPRNCLEPRHIAENGSTITIEQAVVMEKGTAVIGHPKSFDSYRTVPVPRNVQYCARMLRAVETKRIRWSGFREWTISKTEQKKS